MSGSAKDDIGELLREGLDFYGADEIGRAIVAWERVLELDPDNAEARDYIQTADRRSVPRPKSKKARLRRSVLDDALERIDQEDYEGALGFLDGADGESQVELEVQATIELVRSRLLARYRARVGDLESVPAMRAGGTAITKFNLPPDAGFLLSLVDGQTSVGDMLSVSGMDPFDAFRILQGLLDTEIVSMRQ